MDSPIPRNKTVDSITFQMLRLLSSEVQGPKYFRKSLQPCHDGIQMSTHLPEFQ